MTSKEKAKQLVDKFYQTTPNESWINQPIGLKEEYKAWKQSKQCALIAVDELIKEQTMWQNGEVNPVLYWQEVKQEINQINN